MAVEVMNTNAMMDMSTSIKKGIDIISLLTVVSLISVIVAPTMTTALTIVIIVGFMNATKEGKRKIVVGVVSMDVRGFSAFLWLFWVKAVFWANTESGFFIKFDILKKGWLIR
jgi:hypothetical protein